MTARRTFLVAGAVLLGSALVAFATRAGAILASHPAYLALLVLVAAAGGVLVAVGLRTRSTAGGAWRIAGRAALLLVAIAVAGGLLWLRPFRVGEYVSMIGVEGKVEDIKLFNTILSHPDMSRVVVPNRKIVGELLHNYGKIRQLDITVSIGQESDLATALAAVDDVLRRNAKALKDPAPVVTISLRAPALIDIAVKPWVAIPDFGAAGSEIARAVAETFRERKIAAPVPQREIRMLG